MLKNYPFIYSHVNQIPVIYQSLIKNRVSIHRANCFCSNFTT